MPSVFSKIIAGELPGRFVWRDDRCVAFLSINPLRPGHALVVPRDEVDHWLDLSDELSGHLMGVAQVIGRAQMDAFRPNRIGLLIAGFEIPHTHLHVVPVDGEKQLSFANQDRDPDPAKLDASAEAIRAALRRHGVRQVAE